MSFLSNKGLDSSLLIIIYLLIGKILCFICCLFAVRIRLYKKQNPHNLDGDEDFLSCGR